MQMTYTVTSTLVSTIKPVGWLCCPKCPKITPLSEGLTAGFSFQIRRGKNSSHRFDPFNDDPLYSETFIVASTVDERAHQLVALLQLL